MTALAGVWVSDYYGVLVLNRDGSYEGDHIFPSGTKNMWRAEAGVLSLFAESGYSGEPLAVLRRGADVLVADGIPLKRVRMPECKIPPRADAAAGLRRTCRHMGVCRHCGGAPAAAAGKRNPRAVFRSAASNRVRFCVQRYRGRRGGKTASHDVGREVRG